ncbi:MAG: sigma-70 family RNA polymerase sigma factor [Gloeobacteraceae cyanobacterium ES-bin-316]|nr:sigma-70 family RNA polymerase sigma factor [Ferruginibacter sp.]
MPDDELVVNYKTTGDLRVLSDLYQRYMELVYGVCLKYLKDEEEAKDAVLNIYEELVNKVKKYEINNFKSWLYQLAKNHCLMKLRSGKKFIKAPIDVSLMQNEETVHLNGVMEKEEHFKHLDFCMQQLIPEQRQVVSLFYLEGKCYNEITALTDIEWKQVRSFIQNGRRNLKICMDKQISIS